MEIVVARPAVKMESNPYSRVLQLLAAVGDFKVGSPMKLPSSVKVVRHRMVILLPLAAVAVAPATMMRVADPVEALVEAAVEVEVQAEPAVTALIPPLVMLLLPKVVQVVQVLITV